MTFQHRFLTAFLLTASAAASIAATPAFAQSRSDGEALKPAANDRHVFPPRRNWSYPDQVRQDVSIRYEDLDLSKDQGARLMLSRIEQAATAACTLPYEVSPEADEKAREACREVAIRTAVARLNQPLVTAAARQSVLAAR